MSECKCECVCTCACVTDSLVAKLRGTEEEASPQHTHTGSHRNSVKVLDTDLSYLMYIVQYSH